MLMQLYRRTAQTQELVRHIELAILDENNPLWIYKHLPERPSQEEALFSYTTAFDNLVEATHAGRGTPGQHVTRERFKFIDADVTSRLLDSELRASTHHMNWQWLLRDTLLVSRTQAISEGDIKQHLTKGEIIRLPLVDRVSVPTVARYLRDELLRGNLVCGEVDKKEKWWAPSVSSIVNWWIHKLAWFAIRMVVLGRDKPMFQRMYKQYWCDDLGMPGPIWDWVQEQNWTVTARPVLFDADSKIEEVQESLNLKLIDGGRDAN
jgi:hypothetical protein